MRAPVLIASLLLATTAAADRRCDSMVRDLVDEDKATLRGIENTCRKDFVMGMRECIALGFTLVPHDMGAFCNAAQRLSTRADAGRESCGVADTRYQRVLLKYAGYAEFCSAARVE